MVPVAFFVYESVGLEPLFAFNAATFLVAACFETSIKGGDTHVRSEHGSMLREFREGVAYLKSEPGLMVIRGVMTSCDLATSTANDTSVLGTSMSLNVPDILSLPGLFIFKHRCRQNLLFIIIGKQS